MNEVQFYCSICASSLQSNHVNSMLLVGDLFSKLLKEKARKKPMYLHQCDSTLNFNNLILNLDFFLKTLSFSSVFILKKAKLLMENSPQNVPSLSAHSHAFTL